MKTMYRVVISLGLLFSLILLASGCGDPESDAALIRRARLVANENIALKKQLEEKDKHIAQLEKQIEQLKQEKQHISEQTDETTFRLLQMTAEAEQRADTLRQENEWLKQQLEQVQSP